MSLHHFPFAQTGEFYLRLIRPFLWVNKNAPCHMTSAVVRMACCCNSVILLAHLDPGALSSNTVHFSKYSIQQRGQEQELIHPVQNHLTLVSLVSIFWHIFRHFEWIYKYKRNPSSQFGLAQISFSHVLLFRLSVRRLDRPCASLLIHTDSLIFSNRPTFPWRFLPHFT